jgi:hypothetical protein
LSVKFDLANWPWAPTILAAIFLAIPVTLYVVQPFLFWSVTDNEPLGLGNALNMAYRLADFQMYPAGGLSYHPGVPFYLMNWIALALSGYPVATGGMSFFNAVLDHVETYQRMMICLAALAGAAGVYVFVRTARRIAPVGAAIIGLLFWLVSSPASILTFLSPGFESFAVLLNALFFAVLVPLAYEKDLDPAIVILAACVGALAYMNKLSYIYIPLALGSAILARLVFCRAGWVQGARLIFLFVFAFAAVVLATVFLLIGWPQFVGVLSFHRIVILGSGLYGGGDQTVVSGAEVWRAITSIQGDKSYAMPLAVVGGMGVAISGVATGIRNPQQGPVAIIGIATGVAALLSGIIVLKHYDIHYTAGVSATLPALAISIYLAARAWNYKVAFIPAAVAAGAILLMASPVVVDVGYYLNSRLHADRLAQADLAAIEARTAGSKRVVYYTYKAPFAQFGEGFVLNIADIPRLTFEYLRTPRDSTNSVMAGLAARPDVGFYVIDKNYVRDAEVLKHAANLDPMGPKPLQFKEGDELIELQTVLLLIPGPPS